MSFGKEPPDIEASATTVAEPLFSKFFSNDQRNHRWLSRLGILVLLTNLVLGSDILAAIPRAWFGEITGRDRPWYASSPSANREFLAAIKKLIALGSFNDRAAIKAVIGVELEEKVDAKIEGKRFYSFASSQEGHWWKSIYVEDYLKDDKEFAGNRLGAIVIDLPKNVCVSYEDIDKAIKLKSIKTETPGNEYKDVSYDYKPIIVSNGYLFISMTPEDVFNRYSCIQSIGLDNRSTLTPAPKPFGVDPSTFMPAPKQ